MSSTVKFHPQICVLLLHLCMALLSRIEYVVIDGMAETDVDTFLHSISHSPPLSDFWVGSHALHIKVCTDILENRKEGAVIVEEDRIREFSKWLVNTNEL